MPEFLGISRPPVLLWQLLEGVTAVALIFDSGISPGGVGLALSRPRVSATGLSALLAAALLFHCALLMEWPVASHLPCFCCLSCPRHFLLFWFILTWCVLAIRADSLSQGGCPSPIMTGLGPNLPGKSTETSLGITGILPNPYGNRPVLPHSRNGVFR